MQCLSLFCSLYFESEKNIQAGDTIIVASTGSPTVIGKPALISESVPDTQIGAFLRIVRPYLNALCPYVQLVFTTEYYREHIRSKAKGTNINNIKAEYIEETYSKNGDLLYKESLTINDKDGMWKF